LSKSQTGSLLQRYIQLIQAVGREVIAVGLSDLKGLDLDPVKLDFMPLDRLLPTQHRIIAIKRPENKAKDTKRKEVTEGESAKMKRKRLREGTNEA
jgi:hypothetical protein